MFCSSCGTQLFEEANFCWKCGKSQKQGLQAGEIKWEICEIDFRGVSKNDRSRSATGYFLAQATGAKGAFEAGRTKDFQVKTIPSYINKKEIFFDVTDDLEKREIYRALVASLLKDGWEPIPDNGSNWWAKQKFRRAR